MSAEDSHPRFVVLIEGSARYWGDTREEAQARYDRDLALHREGKNPVFWPDDEMRVEEITDQVFVCPLGHRLLFQPDGWVTCSKCGKVWWS